MKKLIAEGRHKGWASRKNKEMSYAEKYVANLFDELQIAYVREVKVGRWFADFVINTTHVIEVDGRQHRFPDRQASDAAKDAYLNANGWQVLRLSWVCPSKEMREEFKSKIQEFIGISPGGIAPDLGSGEKSRECSTHSIPKA